MKAKQEKLLKSLENKQCTAYVYCEHGRIAIQHGALTQLSDTCWRVGDEMGEVLISSEMAFCVNNNVIDIEL